MGDKHRMTVAKDWVHASDDAVRYLKDHKVKFETRRPVYRHTSMEMGGVKRRNKDV